MKRLVPLAACLAVAVVFVGAPAADTVGPSLALSESSPFESVSGSTLYYSPAGSNSGSFTVTASATAGSGIASVDFPVVFGSDSSTVSSSPWNWTYSWTSSAAASGAKTVTVHDGDADADTADFTVTPDTLPPAGQTVALSGGPNYSTLFVPLVLADGADNPGGSDVDHSSGVVLRASATLTNGTCGSFGSFAPVTLTSGADITVASGNCYRYEYRIADNVGNLSAPSAPSADAKVSSAVASLTDTAPTEVSGGDAQFWNGTTKTLWFRPTASGSFNLNATASDPAAGITKVTFPDVSSVNGWSGSTGGIDTSAPYSSPVTYTWAAGATAPGASNVVATNGTGATITDTIAIGSDSTAPSGQSVALTGGPWFTSTVPLTIAPGTDAGAGIDATRSVTERASAPLANGVCGTFGAFSAVTLSSGADATVASAHCYRYQYKATDNVGNASPASPPSQDAKVDKSAPSTPALLFNGFSNTGAAGNVVYFRPGGNGSFTVTAASSDPESGIASYSFPAIPGFTAAGSGPHRTYAFVNGAAAATGQLPITATDAAGLTSGTASFSLVPDATAPVLTVRCNGAPCSSKPYRKTVMVTFSANDTGSGVDAIRWTTDGTDPTATHGYTYSRAIPVRDLARMKIRAFDNAGNAGTLTTVTVVSLASRLVVAAPVSVTVVKTPKGRFVQVKLSSTRRGLVSASLTGNGLRKALHWNFVLDPGTSLVRLRLPATLKRAGTYRVVWTVTSDGHRTQKSTRVTVRR